MKKRFATCVVLIILLATFIYIFKINTISKEDLFYNTAFGKFSKYQYVSLNNPTTEDYISVLQSLNTDKQTFIFYKFPKEDCQYGLTIYNKTMLNRYSFEKNHFSCNYYILDQLAEPKKDNIYCTISLAGIKINNSISYVTIKVHDQKIKHNIDGNNFLFVDNIKYDKSLGITNPKVTFFNKNNEDITDLLYREFNNK